MNILKKWLEDPSKLEKEGLPIDWFETTEEECLEHTEGSGYWKEGVALDVLEQGLEVHTPSAIYKKGEPTGKSTEEIEKLKRNWLADPCWDIETTEGFEDHVEELLNFRRSTETEFEAKKKEREDKRHEFVMGQTGVLNKSITAELCTWHEIERELSSLDQQIGDAGSAGAFAQFIVSRESVRADLLIAAQLKRIADALENIEEGDSLMDSVRIWGTGK